MASITNILDQAGLETLVNNLNTRTVKSISISGTTLTYTLMDGSTKTCTISDATTATKVGSSTVGSGTKPIYSNSGTLTASSSTVGSSTNPVYLNSGTLTASSSTVGSASTGVYLKSGVITACTSGSGTAYITATGHSGASWYRKYSDGFIEQGGIITIQKTALQFHSIYP